MTKTLLGTCFLVATTVMAYGQTVRVAANSGSLDIWGGSFNSSHKITFKGKVTGIETVRPTGARDSEVTLLVRNRDGGGTAVVDLGPAWYVNHQVAKIRVGDNIQVTGSKTMVDGKGIILSQLIRVGGQGAPVLALRRPNGRAYWVGTEVAENNAPVPTGPNVITGTIQQIIPYTFNNVPYQAAVLANVGGNTYVDLGPTWYYGMQNVSYQIGQGVSVVVGPNPITVGSMTIMPSYSIYSGPNIYTVRNANGVPIYNWTQ